MLKVLSFPLDINPYQRLLYGALQEAEGVEVRHVRRWRWLGALPFPLSVALRRLQGYRVIHIHWPAFSLALPLPYRRELSLHYMLACLRWLRMLGYRIVWTVHDALPHEPETSDDLRAGRALAAAAAAKIVHSRASLRQLQKHGYDESNVHIIPHGNYRGVYPESGDAAQARATLGLPRDAVVLLFFGLIRPYKGVAELIDAFERIPDPRARLLIAGKSLDPRVDARLQAPDRDPRIVAHTRYIADEEVATFYRAADVAVLPFTEVTTSGSALLALTFGMPLVASRVGDLADLPPAVGYMYDADDPEGLKRALTCALHADPLALRAARAVSGTLSDAVSWKDVARETARVYRSVLGCSKH
jgi:glycosyltransferase involved in cell wall biosynthesis